MTAPVGMARSLTGGGDCRTLLRVAKSWETTGSIGVGGPSDLVIEGERLCRLIYEAEEWDRGSCGRPVMGDRGTSSLMDELRLTTGLTDFDEAGDC